MRHTLGACLNIFFYFSSMTSPMYTLSLHDALPIYFVLSCVLQEVDLGLRFCHIMRSGLASHDVTKRSEEHTSELQSRFDLVCRLLLEKKNNKTTNLTCKKAKIGKVMRRTLDASLNI